MEEPRPPLSGHGLHRRGPSVGSRVRGRRQPPPRATPPGPAAPPPPAQQGQARRRAARATRAGATGEQLPATARAARPTGRGRSKMSAAATACSNGRTTQISSLENRGQPQINDSKRGSARSLQLLTCPPERPGTAGLAAPATAADRPPAHPRRPGHLRPGPSRDATSQRLHTGADEDDCAERAGCTRARPPPPPAAAAPARRPDARTASAGLAKQHDAASAAQQRMRRRTVSRTQPASGSSCVAMT